MHGAGLWALGAALSLLVVSRATTARPRVPPRAPLLKLDEPYWGRLVALTDEGMVFWGHARSLRIVTAREGWSGPIDLGLDGVQQVVADPDGFLVSGWKDITWRRSRDVVLLVNPRGVILDRWEGEHVWSIATADGKRWATTCGPRPYHVGEHRDLEKESKPIIDNLVELERGGKIERRGLVEMGANIAAFNGGRSHSLRVDCIAQSVLMEPFFGAYCTAIGFQGWRKIGVWDRMPFSCGEYLIEIRDKCDGKYGAAPGAVCNVIIRRLDNGEIAGRRGLTGPHAIACGAPGELLVGRAGIQGLSLPDLAPLWRAPAGRGHVVTVVRTGDRITATTHTGAVVTFVQPPSDK